MKWNKTKKLVVFAMFGAVIFLLAFTPIGFIQLGFIKATIIHIPVIIGSILLGPAMGAGLGFLFGLTSLISNTMTPAVSSFAFSPLIPVPGTAGGSALSLLVCFVPRILVGITPWLIYRGLQRLSKDRFQTAALAVAGVGGALTNTLFVMHLIYFLFQDAYASVQGVPAQAVYGIISSIIVANGLPGALVAGVLTAAICKALMATLKRIPSAAH